MKRLEIFRKQIDEIDSQLIHLLNTRANLAIEIGKIKKEYDRPIYAPDREESLLNELAKKNNGPLTDRHLQSIFIEILSASRAVEELLTISYTEQEALTIARERFGAASQYIKKSSLNQVFQSVESLETRLGIIPFTDTHGQLIHESLPPLLNTSLTICTQLWLGTKQKFLVISQIAPPPSENDQAIVFCRFSSSFQEDILPLNKELNPKVYPLSKIQSLDPSQRSGFIIVFDKHGEDPIMKQQLASLIEISEEIRLLGSFPRG